MAMSTVLAFSQPAAKPVSFRSSKRISGGTFHALPQSDASTASTATCPSYDPVTAALGSVDHNCDASFTARAQVAASLPTVLAAMVAFTPTPVNALAGTVPSALMAWGHFVGLAAVGGGLVSERLMIKRGLTIEEEIGMNNADGIYGIGALTLLITGLFRATDFAKGWDFYKNEPIFWLKMSSVAVLGGLSFFPTIILFRRDQARRQGEDLEPLSDAIIDRMTTIINAELLAFLSIPLMASMMARGVLYVDNLPWALGIVLYALSLGGAGFKYGKEAFEIMDSEGALDEVSKGDFQ